MVNDSTKANFPELWDKIIDVNNNISPNWRNPQRVPMIAVLMNELKNPRNTDVKNYVSSIFVFLVTLCEQYNVGCEEFEKIISEKVSVNYDKVMKQWEASFDKTKRNMSAETLGQKDYYDYLFSKGYVGDHEAHQKYAGWLYWRFNPKSILDVGSGSGYMSKYLLQINSSLPIVNLDISDEAFKLNKFADSVVADMCHLPFKDKSFHCLNCNGVLEHLKTSDISSALNEFERVAEIKICSIALRKGADVPQYLNREHQTVASRKWWRDSIGDKRNWVIGGLDDLDKNGEPDCYLRKGFWSLINFNE